MSKGTATGGGKGSIFRDDTPNWEADIDHPTTPAPEHKQEMTDPDPPLNPILDGLLRFVGWR